MVEQKISLDFTKNGVQRTVHARQGENAARDILISLVSNGEPVDVNGLTLWVIYPDGTHSVPEARNPVKVTIPQALCLTVGEKICEIQVKHGADLLYSPQFRIQVEGTILGASGSSEPIGDPTTYEPNIAVNATEYTGTLDDVKIPVIDPTTDTTKWISPEGLQPDLTELRGDVDDLQEDVADIQEELENIGGTEIFDGQFNAAGGIVLSNGKTYQDIIAALTDEKMVLLRVSDAYSDLYLSYRGYNRGWVDTPQALMYGYSLAFGYDSEYERRLYAAVSQLTTGNTFNLIEHKYYTAAEKTKLAGIEAGAEVNDVTDVQDASGNSLVTSKVAVIPNAMIEIFDKTENYTDYAKYTGSDLYSLIANSGGKLYCINGNQIVGMSVVDIDSGSYFIYYLIGGAFSSPADFNCALRRKTLNSSKVLSNDALCGSFSKADFTSTEKNKLAGIAANAQVNTIEKITDSNGTELTITNKTVALPAIPTVPVTDVTVNGTSVVSSGTASVTVPTAGQITSGSTGYATGGDVYSAIGNVEAALSSINTALAGLIGGDS